MKNLSKLRKEMGLTQLELSKKLNLAKSTYARYEVGESEPNLETIFKIAKFFNCSVDYLIGYDLPEQTTGNSPLQKKLIYQISQLDEDLCEIAEATIEGLYVTNQERRIMRERVQTLQKRGVAENDV